MSSIATIDWIFLMILLASMLLGVWRGLVYEVISLLSWMAAFMLAQWLALDAAGLIPMQGTAESVRYAAGFVLVFVGALFVGALISFLIKKAITAVGLRPIDRVLGAGFGVLRGAVLLIAATVVAGMSPLRTSTEWTRAVGPVIATTALASIKPMLPQEFVKYLPE
jgi:membrane protein required for colicin V production